MSYIPCMVHANRVLLTCMYHMNFCLWSLFASPWVRVSCGGPRGASPWARVAFGWALWLRTGLLEPNLPQVTVRGCWAGSGASCACWGVSRGSLSGVSVDPCGLLHLRTCGCAQWHVYFFIFCILLCLIISIPREFTIYVCLIISLPRGFTIFVVFTTSLYILALYILALLWSYTSLGLMLFVVKTTWNKAYSILFYSILF